MSGEPLFSNGSSRSEAGIAMTTKPIIRAVAGIERQLWRIDKISRSGILFDLSGTFAQHVPSRIHIEMALLSMQRLHPLLRTRVGIHDGQVVFREHCQGIRLRLFEGDASHESVVLALNQLVDVESGPPVYLDFYVDSIAHTWRALFTLNHMAVDGLSTLAAIQDFLLVLSESSAVTGKEMIPCTATTTAPSIEMLPPRVRRWYTTVRTVYRRFTEQLRWLLTGYPKKLSHDQSVPFEERQTVFVVHQLEASETAALKAQARSNGTSLHAALCAATLAGLRTEFQGNGPMTLSVYSPTNLRQRLLTADGSPVPHNHLGQFVGYLQCARRVAEKTDLWKIAKSMGDEIGSKVRDCDDLSIHYLSNRYVDWAEHRSSQDMADFRRQARLAERSGFHSTVVSNLGQVSLSVDKRWGTLDRVVTLGCTGPMNVFMSIPLVFDHRLNWSFMWSHPCISSEQGNRLAQACISALRSMIHKESSTKENKL